MRNSTPLGLALSLFILTAAPLGCDDQSSSNTQKPTQADPATPAPDQPEQAEETPATALLESMDNWEPVVFGGDGEVRFDDGSLVLEMGGPLTGVKYTGDLTELLGEDLQPYEITLQAKRVEGLDFFCCLTFPVGTEGHVSLVLGGWSGSTTGISSLDGYDAASNKTSELISYEQDQWYDIRVRVTAEKIDCFLDGKQIVDVKREDYTEFSVRPEVLATVPLGVCTYQTRGDIRNLAVRRLGQTTE